MRGERHDVHDLAGGASRERTRQCEPSLFSSRDLPGSPPPGLKRLRRAGTQARHTELSRCACASFVRRLPARAH